MIDQGLVPTAVSVDPSLGFPSDIACGPTEGAMQSFVAVFIDDGPPGPDGKYDATKNQFTLPASPPTPCSETASYRFVVIGHGYWAEVDGYTQPASELSPAVLGCNTSGAAGSRHQCTADETGKLVPVEPVWKLTCGEQDADHAIAKNNTDVKILGCRLTGDKPELGPTRIVVDPNAALGSLTCSDDDGEVATLTVIPQNSSLPELTDIACGAEPTPYEEDIEAGQIYTFRVEARDAEGSVGWAASCFSVPKAGILNTATCDPLTDRGTLLLSIEGCPDGGTFEVRDADEEGEGLLGTFECGETASVVGVVAGAKVLVVSVFAADGTELPSLECTATVPPAGEGTATCAAAR